MKLDGARVLVVGATGTLGGALAAELAGRGARLTLAGRDPARLVRAAGAYPGTPAVVFDAYDPESCARAVHGAAAGMGGLDAVVTAFGAVAFGPANEVGDEIAEHLMAVNVLAPVAFFRAALTVMEPGSTIAALTGVVAERPQPRMADYSASKAALSAWLGAVRRETRAHGIHVLDIRPGHLDTGFADRAVAGTAPPMPPGGDPLRVVAAVADAMEADAELLRSAADGTPVVERRAR
ncbi:SDR family NAD(P)-dependent oxidoreductase [Streptomyces sp. WMMC897]|uniref:SDR family NAD(P)-dependent oxidoreductase n=1 Tax=Streptomyces sp. WMMC897 TaxID=3014782 RepID=UPI0022B69B50|nr:SDR family oxidoreductase [Streptomyces sp. WMMC897]MCZ7415870.1 SDR family NAD(P)-dependent oxidoreductase [Streptomyces sp. WMMC897]